MPDSLLFSTDTGLLLVGHGTRDLAGMAEFGQFARLVEQEARPATVETAFLEFAQPTIAEGLRALVRRGCNRVVVAPVLLFAAGHARRDIPAAVASVAAEFPEVPFRQAAHLGCHPRLVALSRQRCEAALLGACVAPGRDTALVLVGRGSHDREATQEMRRFARLLAVAPASEVRERFVAMAQPPLEQVLEELAAQRPWRVVVQPHFLFDGVLVERIRQLAERYVHAHPGTQWLTAAHLGPSEELARALLERAVESLAAGPVESLAARSDEGGDASDAWPRVMPPSEAANGGASRD